MTTRAQATSSKILVVEDEPQIARLVELHLKDQGHEVRLASTLKEGRRSFEEGEWDLLVLDLMLPDGDGLDLCREVRASGSYVPVLILTARSEELDRVLGLELGADDYLTKPFSVRELAARVKAILRRVDVLRGSETATSPLRVEELVVDPTRRKVTVADEEVHLTAKEFDLLLFFASHPGHVFTRSQLLDQVWGYGAGTYEHTVNSHINRLRGKIEADPSEPRYIQTVWGVGYRFLDPEETTE